jgi:hypothetical protein
MHDQRNIKIIFAIVFAIVAVSLQAAIKGAGSDYPGWWLILNIVPYLFGFAVDVAAHQSPDVAFYVGIVCQWFLLGYLAGEIYLKKSKGKQIDR